MTLAWDANAETDLSGYYVGYRTSPSGSETLVPVGNTTQWTLTTAVAGNTYYFRVYAENTSGLRSAPSNEVSTIDSDDAAAAKRRRAGTRARSVEFRLGPGERHDARSEDAGTAHDGHANRGRRSGRMDRGQRRQRQQPYYGLADERQRNPRRSP